MPSSVITAPDTVRRAATARAQEQTRRPLTIAMVHLSDFRIDSRIQRLAGALAERGDQVHLVCIGERARIGVGRGSIHVHPVPGGKPTGGAASYLRGYARFLAGATRRVTMLDRRLRLDLVEAHNMPDLLTAAALIPRLRGVPLVLNVHDTFPELFATTFGRRGGDGVVRLIEAEERWAARLANRLIVVTAEAQRRLEQRGVGCGRTSVVMNSPDERVFGPPRAPRLLPADGPVRLLYHGGLAPRFGVETLVRAVGLLPERVRLRICGTGDPEERRDLARLGAEVAPGRVDIADEAVPLEQIPDELSAADIGIVPTRADEFTRLLLPVKLLEYVHMGLPVVASRLPCTRTYFSDAELETFAPGDPRGLSEAVRRVCADPQAARSRAQRAGRRLAEIAWERQRERYLALVDELCAT